MVIGVRAGSYYVIEEHAAQHKHINSWIAVAKDIIRRYGNIPFYCDPARPEHVASFQEANINAFLGNNRVLSGIEAVATLMNEQAVFHCVFAVPAISGRDIQIHLEEKYRGTIEGE